MLPQEVQLESRESQEPQVQLYNRQDCDKLREAFEKRFADEYSQQIAYDNIYEAFVKNLKESGGPEAKSRNFDLDLFDSNKKEISFRAVGGLSLASIVALVSTVFVVTSVLITMLAIVMFKRYQRVIGANQNGHVY